MQIQDSDFYFDYSGESDTTEFTQPGFIAEGGDIGMSSGALYDSGAGSTNAVRPTWRFSRIRPGVIRGEAKIRLGVNTASAGDVQVGYLDDDSNGYVARVNANTRLYLYKVTAGSTTDLMTFMQFRRSYAQGDVVSLRLQITGGQVALSACLNGNDALSYVDSSSPHLTGLQPIVRVSGVAKVTAIGIDRKVTRPTYDEVEIGLKTDDITVMSIKDGITRCPIDSPDALLPVTFEPIYGDRVKSISAPIGSPDGSEVSFQSAGYILQSGVPNARVFQFLPNIATTNLSIDWVTANLNPVQYDLRPFAGEALALATVQLGGAGATGNILSAVADGYSATGQVPLPFGTATPFSSGPGTPNCPQITMTILRQVWPEPVPPGDKWSPVEFIEPVKFFG